MIHLQLKERIQNFILYIESNWLPIWSHFLRYSSYWSQYFVWKHFFLNLVVLQVIWHSVKFLQEFYFILLSFISVWESVFNWIENVQNWVHVLVKKTYKSVDFDLPPPRAVIAGSPPDRGRAWWEPWARIQAGISRQRESRPARTQTIAATYTFKVEGDSLCSNLSSRKGSTTPIVLFRGSSRWEEH